MESVYVYLFTPLTYHCLSTFVSFILQPVLEVVCSRMRYISSQIEKKIRIVTESSELVSIHIHLQAMCIHLY